MNTARFIARRLLQVLPVVLAIAAMNFLLLQLAPGDAADILAGQMGHASPELVEQMRRDFGLDRPLYQQFFIYLGKLLSFESRHIQHPAAAGHRPDHGAPAGDRAADDDRDRRRCCARRAARHRGRDARSGRWLDSVISVLALVVYATPAFWLGLMLIVLFSVYFDLLPSGGMMTIGSGKTGLTLALDIARHLVLPATTLGLFYVAIYARLMRASMLEVYNLDFITTARAKGLTEGRIAWTHAFRNALLPVVTLAGVQFGHLLGGSILVETVFAWPGLGRLVFDALLQRDLNLLLGILFVSSVVVILANLIVDLTYGFLDPRIVHK